MFIFSLIFIEYSGQVIWHTEHSAKSQPMSSQYVSVSVLLVVVGLTVCCSMLSILPVVCTIKKENWNSGGQMLPANAIT